jgi:two-component system, sensor histidine kinase and response regulator
VPRDDRPVRDILIVEDSATQALALAALLEEQGYTTRVATAGREALAALRERPADLVLSDVIMPGMSGFDLCRAIKSEPALRDISVVLLTSLADPHDVIRGLEAGADNYITKPFAPDRLLARLDRVFRNRDARGAREPGDDVPISFLGHDYVISSGREQILELLISSFEELSRTNQALRKSEQERALQLERERAAMRDAEEARLRAEEANRSKSEFLAMMSHDLRTPLNAIGGYAELLAMGVYGAVTDEQKAHLERISRNQRLLLAMVTDVLNFARLERSELTFEPRPIPLHTLLAELRMVIEPQIVQRGQRYEYVASDKSIVVHADRDRLEQVMLNLLGNAIKFTPEGGSITVRCERQDSAALITVRDTGIGIPADRLESIFEPFVQVDSSRHGEQKGVGLGLAISRNLAQRMGGDLAVESTPGQGSTFCLTLPLATEG